jgi:hypothetical protein
LEDPAASIFRVDEARTEKTTQRLSLILEKQIDDKAFEVGGGGGGIYCSFVFGRKRMEPKKS